MKFANVKNLDELLKVAVPQDIREEFHPDQANKDTEEENVFPASALSVDVIEPLTKYIQIFEESGMLPNEFLDQLINLKKELITIWIKTQNFTEGRALQREEPESMTLPA